MNLIFEIYAFSCGNIWVIFEWISHDFLIKLGFSFRTFLCNSKTMALKTFDLTVKQF